jgi:hypothetical protein
MVKPFGNVLDKRRLPSQPTHDWHDVPRNVCATHIRRHNMLKTIIVVGFFDKGALQRVHSIAPDE